MPLIFCKSKVRHKSSQRSSSCQNKNISTTTNKKLENAGNCESTAYVNLSIKFLKAYQSHWIFWLVKGLPRRFPQIGNVLKGRILMLLYLYPG